MSIPVLERMRDWHPEISIHHPAGMEWMRTRALISEGLALGVAPSFCFGVWQKKSPNRFWVYAHGKTRLDAKAESVTPETVFDLASLTKVMATATLTGALMDRGWITLEQSLATAFPRADFEPIRLKHLLSHTAGLIWWEPYWQKILGAFGDTPLWKVPVEKRQKKMRELILSVVPQVAPGTRVEYSDVSAMLIGFWLEEVLTMSFDHAVTRNVFRPLRLPSAQFRRTTRSPAEADSQVAATENCPWRGSVLQGQVHDDNCWSMGGYSAHAGVFGTVYDVLLWMRGLTGGFISRPTLNALWDRVTEPKDAARTYGFDLGISSVGKYFSSPAIGHTGFTGTSVWYDRQREFAVVLLSNRIHPTRENIRIREFRPRFHDAVIEDLWDMHLLPRSS